MIQVGVEGVAIVVTKCDKCDKHQHNAIGCNRHGPWCVCVCQLEHASAKVCLQHSSVVLAVEVLVEDTPRNVIVAASDLKPSTPRTLPEVAAPTEVAQHSYSFKAPAASTMGCVVYLAKYDDSSASDLIDSTMILSVLVRCCRKCTVGQC